MTTDPDTEFAPAKINLCLHVTGRRDDGYHFLDSLVVFAGVGDHISLSDAAQLTLQVMGPEASGLSSGKDNLVLAAATAMSVDDVAIELWKALPIASGIGGGSADAAATLRGLERRTGRTPDPAAILALGADVPVCFAGRPARMRGIGDQLSPLPELPQLWCVLVNPRVAIATSRVFAALESRDNAPLPEIPTAGWADASTLARWLDAETRNDLQPAAQRIAPVLQDVLLALVATPDCLLARMSGSGATCLGLFASAAAAQNAAAKIAIFNPDWWVAEAAILS